MGVDINESTRKFRRSRVHIEIIDQSNIEDLVQVALKYSPFDIVVADGSHMWEHQITSLRTLFPFVRSGGLYIVEDLQTSFGKLADTYRGVSSISCADYPMSLAKLRLADDQIDINSEEDAFPRTYGRAIETITFYR